MVDFLPCHASRNHKDGCIYNLPRKQYTRTHPAPKYGFKIKNNPRENVAIIKLRKLGYSINQIADVTGRSRSYIHKRLRTAIARGNIHMVQMRKLPNAIRLRCSSIRRKTLERFLPQWEAYILGEGDKPP